MQGKVKWFNDKKGFGFIQADGSDEDLFVHYSNVLGSGHKTLVENEAVEFEIVRDDKGGKAVNVKRGV